MYQFKNEVRVSWPINEVWTFFSNPNNLSLITPAKMKLHTFSSLPNEVYPGLEILHRVSPIAGIPLLWKTRITEVNAPFRFVDLQVSGPFSFWKHTHLFEAEGNETIITDIIDYRPPFGVLGRLTHNWVTRPMMNKMFQHRNQVIHSLLASSSK